MKAFAPSVSNSFLYEMTPVKKADKNDIGRIAFFPESEHFHLKTAVYVGSLKCVLFRQHYFDIQ